MYIWNCVYRDMISGLAHLHDLRIIHCDLKPQNVLIVKGKSLCAKLSGMGITKRLEGDMSSLGFRVTNKHSCCVYSNSSLSWL